MALDILDYVVVRFVSLASQAPTGGNTVILAAASVPIGYKWVINCLTVQCSAGKPTFSMFDQDPATGAVPCNSTVAGVLDCDNSGEILINGGDQLFMAWYNVPKGAICKARVQYQLATITEMARTWGT